MTSYRPRRNAEIDLSEILDGEAIDEGFRRGFEACRNRAMAAILAQQEKLGRRLSIEEETILTACVVAVGTLEPNAPNASEE